MENKINILVTDQNDKILLNTPSFEVFAQTAFLNDLSKLIKRWTRLKHKNYGVDCGCSNCRE